MTLSRKPYPSDVGDEGWALVAPYLTLLPEEASQREHPLREVFNGLRTIVKTGAPWRWMPNDLPPWAAVYQQAQRWLQAGCFEKLAHDLLGRSVCMGVGSPKPGASSSCGALARRGGNVAPCAVDPTQLVKTPCSAEPCRSGTRRARADGKAHETVSQAGHGVIAAPSASAHPCMCVQGPSPKTRADP